MSSIHTSFFPQPEPDALKSLTTSPAVGDVSQETLDFGASLSTSSITLSDSSGDCGSLHIDLSISTLDPDAALQAVLNIIAAANEGIHEEDFTPDRHGVIIPPHVRPGVPGISLVPPPEGDVQMPSRPYVDAHTYWLYGLPEPWFLAPPPMNISGHVLLPSQYRIVQLDADPGQDGELFMQYPDDALYAANDKQDGDEQDGDEHCAEIKYQPSFIVPLDTIVEESESSASLPQSSTTSSIQSSADVLPLSAVPASVSTGTLGASLSAASITAMDVAYVSKRRVRPRVVRMDSERWTEIVVRPSARRRVEGKPTNPDLAGQEDGLVATVGEGSWVKISTRPSKITHSSWTVIEGGGESEEFASAKTMKKGKPLAQVKQKLGATFDRLHVRKLRPKVSLRGPQRIPSAIIPSSKYLLSFPFNHIGH
jgi:hypothetical protein